jgi:hydroxylamine reductase
MFCYQCEQTAKGTGCTVQGVCGKLPDVAALQDLLIYSLMGLSQVAIEGRKVGISDNDVNVFTVKAAFSTLTNVDFDPDRFMDLISQTESALLSFACMDLRLRNSNAHPGAYIFHIR